MRAIGFQQGQFGDIVISTVVARAFKQQYPDSKLTLGVNRKYAEILPLVYQHPHFDSFHIYDGYDNWPNEQDRAYLSHARYDIVFPAMPRRHNEATWWQTEHQAQNACTMYGLPVLEDYQCLLNPWFAPYLHPLKDYVAFNYIGGFYAGYPNAKSYSPQRAAEIVKAIKGLGYKVVVLGDPNEPALEGTERSPLSYVESVKVMLSCKAFVGIDSGLTWAASAYSFPTLACYSHSYYGEDKVANIQPRNPNGKYLSAGNVNDIPLDSIINQLTLFLS